MLVLPAPTFAQDAPPPSQAPADQGAMGQMDMKGMKMPGMDQSPTEINSPSDADAEEMRNCMKAFSHETCEAMAASAAAQRSVIFIETASTAPCRS